MEVVHYDKQHVEIISYKKFGAMETGDYKKNMVTNTWHENIYMISKQLLRYRIIGIENTVNWLQKSWENIATS